MNKPVNNQSFRDSLYKNVINRESQAFEYKALSPFFRDTVRCLLDDYGFAARLETAKQTQQPLRLLEINCGEGLYLQELAHLLEERDLLTGADLYGIAEDPRHVSTAIEFSKLSKPPRPYLNFYQHFFHTPLAESIGLCEGLKTNAPARFDFIFGANPTLMVTKNARQLVERLYRDNLKPGGWFYFIESLLGKAPANDDNTDGWFMPHPALDALFTAAEIPVKLFNDGVAVGLEVQNWLANLGAQPIVASKHVLKVGGTTLEGKALLQDAIHVVIYAAPELIKAGLLSQSEYDEFMRVLYNELTPNHVGKATGCRTLACKPF